MTEVVTMAVDLPNDATEDMEAQELLKQWEEADRIPSDDDASVASVEAADYDDKLEKHRREVSTQDNAIDHVVLATSDLDQALVDFEAMTGLKPEMVVSLNGLGTKSARVAFSGSSFLEIVGPDDKQSFRPLGDKLSGIPAGKMVPLHYAVRHSKAPEMKTGLFADMGFECDQVTMVAKDRGMPWTWDMVFLEGHDDGGLVPYFVNWRDSHHASGKLPVVGSLDKVLVRAPAGHKLQQLLADVDGIQVESGDDYFEFTFTSAKGTHTFSSSDLIGISFPKEGGLPVKGL